MSEGVLKKFYDSQEWQIFREQTIIEFVEQNGELFCEECKKHLVDKGDIILHHTPIELTESNYKDPFISLNRENIKIVCKQCHNIAHNRWCGGHKRERKERSVYIVYGPPCSGKSHYVRENMSDGDLVVDMDRLYQAVSFNEMYKKPDNLKINVFSIRNHIIEDIRMRKGNYRTAWIIGGYPEKYTREKLSSDLGAELILIDSDKHECLYKLKQCGDYRSQHMEEWQGYIDAWFEKYVP